MHICYNVITAKIYSCLLCLTHYKTVISLYSNTHIQLIKYEAIHKKEVKVSKRKLHICYNVICYNGKNISMFVFDALQSCQMYNVFSQQNILVLLYSYKEIFHIIKLFIYLRKVNLINAVVALFKERI